NSRLGVYYGNVHRFPARRSGWSGSRHNRHFCTSIFLCGTQWPNYSTYSKFTCFLGLSGWGNRCFSSVDGFRTYTLGTAAIIDFTTVILTVVSLILLIKFRVNSAWLVLLGAAIGVLKLIV